MHAETVIIIIAVSLPPPARLRLLSLAIDARPPPRSRPFWTFGLGYRKWARELWYVIDAYFYVCEFSF